mgnify:CR=1 FL=1
MALIKCYECGKEISSLAPHCIHCGAPRKAQKKKKASKRETSSVELTERQREQIEEIEVGKDLNKLTKLAKTITAPRQSLKHEKSEDVPPASDEDMSTSSAFLYLGGAGYFVITFTLILNIFFNFGFIEKLIIKISLLHLRFETTFFLD